MGSFSERGGQQRNECECEEIKEIRAFRAWESPEVTDGVICQE